MLGQVGCHLEKHKGEYIYSTCYNNQNKTSKWKQNVNLKSKNHKSTRGKHGILKKQS